MNTLENCKVIDFFEEFNWEEFNWENFRPNEIGEEREIIGSAADEVLSGRTSMNPYSNTIMGGEGNDTLLGDIASDNLVGGDGDDILQGTFINPPVTITSPVIPLPTVMPVRPTIENQVDTLTGGEGEDRFILGEFFAGDSFLFEDTEVLYYQDSSDESNSYAAIADFDPTEDVIQLINNPQNYSLGTSSEGTIIYFGAVEDNEIIAILADTQIDNFNLGFDFVSET